MLVLMSIGIAVLSSIILYSREQLLHKLRLEEKEHEEKLTRQRAGKVAELHVSLTAILSIVMYA